MIQTEIKITDFIVGQTQTVFYRTYGVFVFIDVSHYSLRNGMPPWQPRRSFNKEGKKCATNMAESSPIYRNKISKISGTSFR